MRGIRFYKFLKCAYCKCRKKVLENILSVRTLIYITCTSNIFFFSSSSSFLFPQNDSTDNEIKLYFSNLNTYLKRSIPEICRPTLVNIILPFFNILFSKLKSAAASRRRQYT